MPWPTPQEYNEALQNPALSFDDPDLRSGSVELTPLGLPRPITGNFASVYRLHCPGGDRAVRCFWREYADMQDRYAAISRQLKASRLPYTVGFEYLPRGIKIRGDWYPILKMDWVEGRLLDEYVREHLADRTALARLVNRWLEMMVTLERSGIAHGDLQHGNVLVVGEHLKLVDYDCMFVPGLSGRKSHELGHQNYQHPARKPANFGPYLDRFAGRVIFLSLVALSVEPSLWTQLDGGDECLLLRAVDFASSSSRGLSLLLEHGDPRVRTLARELEEAVHVAPEDVPSLALSGPTERTRTHAPGRLLASIAGRFANRGSPVDNVEAPPAWLQDHLAAGKTRRTFVCSFVVPRACTGLCAGMLFLSTRLTPPSAGGIAPRLTVTWCLVVVVQWLILGVHFRRDPAVAEARTIRAKVRRDLRRLGAIQRRVRRLERINIREEVACHKRCERLARRKARRQDEEIDRRSFVESSLERHMGLVASVQAEICRASREELKSKLEAEQQRYISRYLRTHTLRSAVFPGVGLRVKLRLWISGVRTADDVNTRHAQVLKSIGQGRGVIAWRARVQAEAKRTMPDSLPDELRQPILAHYAKRRERLLSYQSSVEEAHNAVLGELTSHYNVAYTWIDERMEVARALCQDRCARLQLGVEEAREELPRLSREVAEARERLETFAGVSARWYVVAALCPWLLRAR